MKKIILFVISILIFCMVGTVNATPITYYYGGVLNYDVGNVTAGSNFYGELLYDTDAVEYYGTVSSPTNGIYHYTKFSLTVGNDTVYKDIFSDWNENMSIYNTSYWDSWKINMNDTQFGNVQIIMDDYTKTVFDDILPPGLGVTLDDFDYLEIGFGGKNHTLEYFTSLNPNPTGVPEPATMILLATSLIGLGIIKRKK